MDVLNPSKTANPGGLAPAPADIFAPLAPLPMPANLFVPSSGVCPEMVYLNCDKMATSGVLLIGQGSGYSLCGEMFFFVLFFWCSA